MSDKDTEPKHQAHSLHRVLEWYERFEQAVALVLSILIAVMGIVYWLMRERDRHAAGTDAPSPPPQGE